MAIKILVFGRSGQVARALAELKAAPTVELEFAGRETLDLLNEDPSDFINASRPSAVINAAAYTAVDRAETETDAAMRLNCEAPAAMAQGCRELQVPFIHISTDYVFDGVKESPYKEDDPVNPLGAYGRSKAKGEAAIAQIGGRWTIFRTAWVVSPNGENFVNTMKRLGAERDVMRVVDDQRGRPTLAADIAAACLDAVERGVDDDDALSGLFHLAGADDATWADIAERVFENLRRRTARSPVLQRITTAEYPTPARRPANSRLDTAKLQAAVGWRPRSWRDTVDLCLR